MPFMTSQSLSNELNPLYNLSLVKELFRLQRGCSLHIEGRTSTNLYVFYFFYILIYNFT